MIFFIPLPRLSISPNLLKKSASKGFLLLDGTVSGFNCWISLPSIIPPGEYISKRSSYISMCISLPICI